MRDLIKVVIFHEKQIIFISIYNKTTLCSTKFDVHCLSRAAKLMRWSSSVCCFVVQLWSLLLVRKIF